MTPEEIAYEAANEAAKIIDPVAWSKRYGEYVGTDKHYINRRIDSSNKARGIRAALLRDLMEPSRAASEAAIEALHAPENKHGAVLDEVLIAYIRTYADENLIELEAKPASDFGPVHTEGPGVDERYAWEEKDEPVRKYTPREIDDFNRWFSGEDKP